MPNKSKSNNFDIIRLCAALMVVVSHQYGFFLLTDPLLILTKEIHMGTVGVNVFFIVSGYLIASSWIRNPNILFYLRNRILRIFPALLFMLCIMIFIIGPLLTNLSFAQYFSSPHTYLYFWNISLIKLSYTLPGVFVRNGQESLINAPLWTLVFEFLMYFFVLGFGLLGMLKKGMKSLFILVLISACILFVSMGISREIYFLKINVNSFLSFFPYFFVGVLFFLNKEYFAIKWWMILLLALLWIPTIGTHFFFLFTFLLLFLSVFFIAFNLPIIETYITRNGDFSYGIYIYGFIVQNILFQFFGERFGIYGAMAMSIIFVAPFALFSWRYVESKALKFKLYGSIIPTKRKD